MCHHVPVDSAHLAAEAEDEAEPDEELETAEEVPVSVPPAPP